MNRADRRAFAKAIRRGKPLGQFIWPKFPSELMFNLLVRNGYITAP